MDPRWSWPEAELRVKDKMSRKLLVTTKAFQKAGGVWKDETGLMIREVAAIGIANALGFA